MSDERSDYLLDILHPAPGMQARSRLAPLRGVPSEPHEPGPTGRNSHAPEPRVIEWDPHWDARPLSALGDAGAPTPWLWEGMLARGAITLLTGLWKSGKTTLVSHLLDAFQVRDSFGGLPLTVTDIVVVSEEHAQFWRRRRDDLNLGDHIAVVTRPFLMRPDLATWEAFIEGHAARLGDRIGLVVFDSLPNLWPVENENDAAAVTAALRPLSRFTELNAAVLCLMHPRKGDGDQAQATRGSGAIGGYADILLEFRRYDAARHDDTRRVISSYSRYEETPAEVVLDYDPATGYRPLGDRTEVRVHERRTTLLELLPDEQPGSTIEQILSRWPAVEPKAARRTLLSDLDALAASGEISRAGRGFRGSAFLYAATRNPAEAQ